MKLFLSLTLFFGFYQLAQGQSRKSLDGFVWHNGEEAEYLLTPVFSRVGKKWIRS